jgi:hypothetical protein
MITIEDHHAALTTLMQLLPMSKQLTGAAMTMAWETFPERAKLDLTGEALLFAVQQRMLDPQPPKDVAPHIALLRYVYPVNRSIRRERGEEVINDHPMVERGLRLDLAKRMADPGQFHELVRSLPQQPPPELPRLAAATTDHRQPWAMTADQRRAHVERIAATVAKLKANGMDDRTWTDAQLSAGRWWFEKALHGFWSMEIEGAAIAAAWVLRNANRADQLITMALAGDVEPVAPETVVASFAGAC